MTTPPSDWSPQPDIAHQQPLAPGRTTNTWAIWVMALLPLLGIVLTLAQNPDAEFHRLAVTMSRQVAAARNGSVVVTQVPFDGGVLLSYALSLILIAIQVFLAIADQRALRRLGVVRPFPWGWVFLNPTYMIGRHVVVRRRVRGSLAPLWVWIVATVVDLAVVGVIFSIAIGHAVSAIQLQ
jgi:hypothetical protein